MHCGQMSEQDKDSGDSSRTVTLAAFMVAPSHHLAWKFMFTLITERS